MKNAALALSCLGALALVGCAADSVGSSAAGLHQSCGGFAGIECPGGATCVDDPRDTCNPARGGADCPGVCRHQHGRRGCGGPDRSYMSRDVETCATIRFFCAEGQTGFSDHCGCGCEEDPDACSATALCVEGYHWDALACACVADGVTCGSTTCGDGEVCCNASCGICAPPDGLCTQEFCSTATL